MKQELGVLGRSLIIAFEVVHMRVLVTLASCFKTRRNPLYFRSWGQRSRSDLAPSLRFAFDTPWGGGGAIYSITVTVILL